MKERWNTFRHANILKAYLPRTTSNGIYFSKTKYISKQKDGMGNRKKMMTKGTIKLVLSVSRLGLCFWP
jgi:hypothetical protein